MARYGWRPDSDHYATTSAKAKPAKPADDRQIMQHDTTDALQDHPLREIFPATERDGRWRGGSPYRRCIKAMAESICDPKKASTASNLLCGAPPIPPSPKDGDERLNLPPPPLADDPNPPKPPPLSTCIAEYKEIKPLSYGCPINTPDLAFKAEMRECIDLFRAGQAPQDMVPGRYAQARSGRVVDASGFLERGFALSTNFDWLRARAASR
jgi:hypothetical protein